jgi:hypothetical protein
MMDGVCTKVLVVVVPSYEQDISLARAPLGRTRSLSAYIFDFFHRKVRICRHANLFRLYIDNYQ